MMKGVSHLTEVKPDPGVYQWVDGTCTGVEPDAVERTHLVRIPYLMPGTVIFVHGVNSEGEWYRDAAILFATGLNKRLGREDLKPLEPNSSKKRFLMESEGKRLRSPIIPFYWGYSVPENERHIVVGSDKALIDNDGNPLRNDGSWGGGPFQNGTSDLLAFWRKEGFKKHVLLNTIDLNYVNAVIGRDLHDCPPRLYYAHAARRLANLVATIRKDFPNEPINIVAHSQGTMITLCALFYIDQLGVRGPDTVILNSSPYHFEEFITDFLTAAEGRKEVQSKAARIKTFANAAAIVQKAKDKFSYTPAPDAACNQRPVHKHLYDDRIFIHQPATNPDWKAEIGAQEIRDGLTWWTIPAHKRDNRGKLFVNFNPADRVIGISAVEGIGWRGIPVRYFDAGNTAMGANIMQRLFARGSNDEHNPAVGARTGYKQPYYYSQIDRLTTRSSTPDANWQTGSGGTLQTENENWHYLDGQTASTQWRIASEKVLGLIDSHGDVSPYGDNGESEYVYINAPVVPEPAVLGENFDLKGVLYNGQARPAEGDQPAVKADLEQQVDFEEDLMYQKHLEVPCTPQDVACVDEAGFKTTRLETNKEVLLRRQKDAGQKVVSPTNHAQILRYGDAGESPVANVLSYDLTVGQGYAFGDKAYWEYLWKLADWKISDPYYGDGKLDAALEAMPPGIDTGTAA